MVKQNKMAIKPRQCTQYKFSSRALAAQNRLTLKKPSLSYHDISVTSKPLLFSTPEGRYNKTFQIVCLQSIAYFLITFTQIMARSFLNIVIFQQAALPVAISLAWSVRLYRRLRQTLPDPSCPIHARSTCPKNRRFR